MKLFLGQVECTSRVAKLCCKQASSRSDDHHQLKRTELLPSECWMLLHFLNERKQFLSFFPHGGESTVYQYT